MTALSIPFNRPCLVGTEQRYVAEAFANGHISGDGPFTKKCEALLASQLGSARALLTTSCTHALEMAALLLDLQPGDEVIVPSFTFVSTANAFALRGAKLVYADIRPDTLNLDEKAVEALITPRTRAIAVVHYAGVGCEMDALLAIAARHRLRMVEDNAHGLFAKYKGRHLGTFGALATQSFHETKNISCGEGGALLVNDAALAERAEILREKGTNRARFFRGQVDKYTWVDIGSSYVPSDLLAAYLYAQLEAAAKIQARRQAVWNLYQRNLEGWAEECGLRLPVVPAHCEQSFHMFYVLAPDLPTRQKLLAALRAAGILAVFHYVPLHNSPMGLRCAARPAVCPVTEDVSDRLIRLPFFNDITGEEQGRVVTAIRQFFHASAAGA